LSITPASFVPGGRRFDSVRARQSVRWDLALWPAEVAPGS